MFHTKKESSMPEDKPEEKHKKEEKKPEKLSPKKIESRTDVTKA